MFTRTGSADLRDGSGPSAVERPSHGSFSTPFGELFIVCTGMRDSPEDLLAGRITFEIVRRVFTSIHDRLPEELFRDSVKEANDTLYERTGMGISPHGHGVDLAAALFDTGDRKTGLMCHVGSSRIYRVRNGAVSRLTQDHVIPGGPFFRDPEEAYYEKLTGGRRLVTRTIGSRREVEPQIGGFDLLQGDRYVIAAGCPPGSLAARDLLAFRSRGTECCAMMISDLVRARITDSLPVIQVVDLE